MNEMINNSTEPRITSLEIAEITGKPHNDVMKAIRTMEPAWQKIAEGNSSLGSYKDKNQQVRPCYSLTKTESLYIATKFNDEARAKLVLRWYELEQKEYERQQNLMQVVGVHNQILGIPRPDGAHGGDRYSGDLAESERNRRDRAS